MIKTLSKPFIQVPDKLRFWTLTTYATHEHILRTLKAHEENIQFCSFILHDRDEKEPHTHINIQTKTSIGADSLRSWFKTAIDIKGEIANTLAKPTLFTPSADLYFTHHECELKELPEDRGSSIVDHHADFPSITGKFQYIENDIQVPYGNRVDYINSVTETETKVLALADRKAQKKADRDEQKAETADDVEQQLQDILDGVSFRDMARKYGRDYIKNYKAYGEYALMMACEEGAEIPAHLLTDPMRACIDVKRAEAYHEGYDKAVEQSINLLQKTCAHLGMEENDPLRLQLERTMSRIQRQINNKLKEN